VGSEKKKKRKRIELEDISTVKIRKKKNKI